MILGLLNSEATGLDRLTNFRRTVFYNYPNGSAPLVALMSMMKEESTNDPLFQIYEKRLAEQKSTTATLIANGPFSLDGTTNATVAGFNLLINAVLYVTVADTSAFRVGHILQISAVPNGAASATMILRMAVTALVSATQVKCRVLEAYTSISNDTDANALEVLVVGNVASEGQVGAGLAPWLAPTPIQNYTQILRTPFQFTGTVLKAGLKFDKTGPYKDKSKDATIQHAREMEFNFLFGIKTLYTDATTGLPTRTTGGILWYLRQWEAGTAYGNTAATVNSDDNKRIIDLSGVGSAMSLNQYEDYLERVFRVTSNQAQEKIVLCGSGFLKSVNKMYRGASGVLYDNTPVKDEWGWDVTSHRTPQGTIHYKTHPLFSQNPTLRNNALFLDVWNILYRYLDGRDTTLLKNRQPNNADYREDEWLTECGMELRFPESHMYLMNFANVNP